MYFGVLSLGTQYFIYKKLKESEINSFILKILISWSVICFVFGIIADIDFSSYTFDIFPLHVVEILRSVYLTWSIITLLGFFAFFFVDLVTGFGNFTKIKVISAITLTIFASLYCMVEAYFVTSREIVITTSKLPEGTDKLRIAYITDSHIGGLYTHWHFERAMKLINDSKPDIFALTGDIIDGDMSYRGRELSMLKEAVKNSRYGAFAVNGNHEYYVFFDQDVEGIIENCGIKMLINERIEAAGITIIGIDDSFFTTSMKPFIKSEDENKFVLILKHRPDIPLDSEGKFDLMISGHTHGGQFWPLGYFKNMAHKSTSGLSIKNGGYVYVSNGAGFNGAMMRLFVPPEVTIIDIVRE